MKYFLVTGSAGLVGSECSEFFIKNGFKILGIDNDSRKNFFGKSGSISSRRKNLSKMKDYQHFDIDIRNKKKIEEVFANYKSKIKCIIHCAAQPSHDWASDNINLDFQINTSATLSLLELFKFYCPNACFINLSTNKVYGDNPNKFKYIESKFRYEIIKTSNYFKKGFDETLSTDDCIHSFFGVSKLSADQYVQEFGKNFNLKTVTFRGGCLTGENHAGVELHGFLSYLIKCIVQKKKYKIFGYLGKQVRDNIHSSDLINCFWHFFKNPKIGQIYNIGGGRENSCSILEVLDFFKNLNKETIPLEFVKQNRKGDHIWWITDYSKFSRDYPKWKIEINIKDIFHKIADFELKQKKRY